MKPATPTARSDLFQYRWLTDAQRSAYEREGYLHYGPALTARGLRAMLAECMEAWDRQKRAFNPDGTWLQNALLPNIHHQSPLVREYYFEGPLVDVATQVIGPNIKGATSQLTFKLRGNTQGFGWHQDNLYGQLDPYNAISCLTALDDCDEENGCLWLIPGSHQEQLEVEHSVDDKNQKREIRVEADDARAVPVRLKAGEAVFFHCWMLHKSEGNRSTVRDRRILFLRYADADAVEVYNDRRPRLGRLLRGSTKFDEVREFERDLAPAR